MKLYLARHGRTNYNDLDLCNADPTVDVHLTETGQAQAQSLDKQLSQKNIDQIYVSQLKRTQQTAAFINTAHHAPIKIDPRLNDIRTGYESKPSREYYTALDQAENKWTARFNDGESIEDTNERVRACINELRALPHQSILIITSEAIVQTIHGILKNLSNQEAQAFHVEQGGYIELDLN